MLWNSTIVFPFMKNNLVYIPNILIFLYSYKLNFEITSFSTGCAESTNEWGGQTNRKSCSSGVTVSGRIREIGARQQER